MRRIYVASCWDDFRRTRLVQELLRSHGFEISVDWTKTADQFPSGDASASPSERIAAAELDAAGVLSADWFLLLTPNDKSKGCGCWVELGIALAAKKRIVITGAQRQRTIFCDYGHRFEFDHEGVEYIVDAMRGYERFETERGGREFG